ncbi:MAG: hypothetical protein MUP81_02725, partial [Dehalococcoidia bacterium]|nr:hypothetical protein [Dehalococcoidia bacterium]
MSLDAPTTATVSGLNINSIGSIPCLLKYQLLTEIYYSIYSGEVKNDTCDVAIRKKDGESVNNF